MTWTRLGDDDNDRPDHLSVSRSARLLNHEAKVYCNKHTTDGYLPAAALARITDSADPRADADELVNAAIWELTDTGWQVDWTDQETAEDVRARQAFNAEKQKRYRRRKGLHERGDHSECDSRFCKAVTSNATSNVTGLVTPSRPDPSRPPGRDRDKGAKPRGAGAPQAGPAGKGDLLATVREMAGTGDETARRRLAEREAFGHAFNPDESGLSCRTAYGPQGDERTCGLGQAHIIHYGFIEAAS